MATITITTRTATSGTTFVRSLTTTFIPGSVEQARERLDGMLLDTPADNQPNIHRHLSLPAPTGGNGTDCRLRVCGGGWYGTG